MVAYTFCEASLVPVTVTVACSFGVGVTGLIVAVIVPAGLRNVIVWVIGVLMVLPLAANQMQNVKVPGVVQ